MNPIYYILIIISMILVNSCGNSYSNINEPYDTKIYVNDEFKSLNLHNQARSDVNIDNLVWDIELEEAAIKYANILANNGKFEHDTDTRYGENLYTSSVVTKTPFTNATIAWVDEKQFYHYHTNSCVPNQQCGHYTQIVWKDTAKVGCAVDIYKTGPYKGWEVVVCKYSPHGNIIGQKPY